MARCVIAFLSVAPCQCLTPGGVQITSPGLISCFGPPSCWIQPVPAVTISSCPAGWVCHAERAPNSNVTEPTEVRQGALGWNSGSTRTAPLKYCSAPFVEGCEPLRVMVIDSCAYAESETNRQGNKTVAVDFIALPSSVAR